MADGIEPLTYDITAVATLTGFPKPTVYEHARLDPARWGVLRVGRAIRFRRDAIHALVGGEPAPQNAA